MCISMVLFVCGVKCWTFVTASAHFEPILLMLLTLLEDDTLKSHQK